MAKILIVSHSPYSSTGYGRVVRALAGSLMAAGLAKMLMLQDLPTG
jgi:hypothetical protein